MVAFFKEVNGGFGIEEFEFSLMKQPDPHLPAKLPVETMQTEFLVNQLQTEFEHGIIFQDFTGMPESILIISGVGFPLCLTETKVGAIRRKLYYLVENWKK